MNVEKIQRLNELRQEKDKLRRQREELTEHKNKASRILKSLQNRESEVSELSIEHWVAVDNAQRECNSVQSQIALNTWKVNEINKEEMELRGIKDVK